MAETPFEVRTLDLGYSFSGSYNSCLAFVFLLDWKLRGPSHLICSPQSI